MIQSFLSVCILGSYLQMVHIEQIGKWGLFSDWPTAIELKGGRSCLVCEWVCLEKSRRPCEVVVCQGWLWGVPSILGTMATRCHRGWCTEDVPGDCSPLALGVFPLFQPWQVMVSLVAFHQFLLLWHASAQKLLAAYRRESKLDLAPFSSHHASLLLSIRMRWAHSLQNSKRYAEGL